MTIEGFVLLLGWCGAALSDWPRHFYWACLAVWLVCGPTLTTCLILRRCCSRQFTEISRRYHLDFFIWCSFAALWLLVLAWQHLRVDGLWP